MDDIDTDITDDPWEPWRPRPCGIRVAWELRCHIWRPSDQRAELAARSDIPTDLRAELLADPAVRATGRKMVADGRGASFDDPSVFFDTDTDSPPAA